VLEIKAEKHPRSGSRRRRRREIEREVKKVSSKLNIKYVKILLIRDAADVSRVNTCGEKR
jgi:hypothetical protein